MGKVYGFWISSFILGILFSVPWFSNFFLEKTLFFFYFFPFHHSISDLVWYHPSMSERRISISTSSMFFLFMIYFYFSIRGGPSNFPSFQNIHLKFCPGTNFLYVFHFCFFQHFFWPNNIFVFHPSPQFPSTLSS